jgi:7,8-dihydropterin-6-yl-methyl-4-(beta-D-ribofuranosyl)aminobenzene 5'-phosphate synthase
MNDKVRITVLAENTAAQGTPLLAEHGLAYWIEWGGHRVLFDTGQGHVLAANAYRLGIPLHSAERVVLSHGHYDHTGGLAQVLHEGCTPALYVHPAAFREKYAERRDGGAREIGVPMAVREAISRHQLPIVETPTPTQVIGCLTVTGQVPRTTDFEDTGGRFYLDAACVTPDALDDDQSLFFPTPEGIVVLLGCAHSGIVNTLRYIRHLSANAPIRAIIGGMHLISASPARISRTVEEFRQLGIRLLAPAHCTGMPATAALWNAFPAACATCHVGTLFEFESVS